MKKLLPLLLLLMVYGNAAPSNKEVLHAIEVIENDVKLFPENIGIVMEYAKTSDEIAIEISSAKLP